MSTQIQNASSDKIIVVGIDGFEPSLAKKFMDQGKMPNLKAFVEQGACREDLVLLGGVPTVTPPMWTTLATGAYPNTHGITAFFNQHPDKLDTAVYALDSRSCKAEPLWNVFAEAGKQTLVWHWPGSSWPPTSSSPNLSVVDGTQPTAVNMGTALIDWESIGMADERIEKLIFSPYNAPRGNVNGCVITGLEDSIGAEDASSGGNGGESLKAILNGKEFTTLVMSEEENEISTLGNITVNVCNSPIKAAHGWVNAPADAKEFTIITSAGFVHRPCLILKNQDGIYDRVAIYKSKKELEPIVTLQEGVYTPYVKDEILHEEEKVQGYRSISLLELREDGSYLRYWMSSAYNVEGDLVWHPKSLYREIAENVGMPPQLSTITGKKPENITEIILPALDYYCDWQANCLRYLMENEKYDIIFSHLHNVDDVGHMFWHFAKHFDDWGNDEHFYQGAIEKIYIQTDRYLGTFLPFLEKDWSIVITSDHGLICEEHHLPVLTEGCVSVPVMKELGYTVLKTDENGNELREIDWEKTRAIAIRAGNIYINLKGRNPQGIVEPEYKYELEGQIISDLYNYRDPRTGKRVVSLALRNKDAVILGVGGNEEFGDVIFFMDEGFNLIHMDSLPTYMGYFDTSVSPIFVAAGKGFKNGYYTDRHIRQVDLAPTLAVLGGVRVPAQNEGSVIHQILE